MSNKGKKNQVDSPAKTTAVRVGWAEATAKVVLYAIEKGVVVPLSLAAVLITIFWGMEGAGKSAVVLKLLELVQAWYMLGWAGMILVLILWKKHSARKDRTHKEEVDRISKERNAAQERAVPALKSSEEAK